MLHGTGSGDDLLDITADGAESEVLGIKNAYVNKDTLIIVGREPSGRYKLLADFHIIRAGRCEQGQKDLMECIGAVVALNRIGGKCMRDHTGQVFQEKTEGIVQWDFAFGDHQSENGSARTRNVDTELWRGDLIARIVKISGPSKRFLIINVLLECIDNGLCGLGGTKNGIFQLSVSEFFGGDNCKVHAGHHHGIGDDAIGQIQKLLNGASL